MHGLFKWDNIKPIEKEGKGIVAAKMIVYAGEDEEYYTFISRAAFFALKEWVKYRRNSGDGMLVRIVADPIIQRNWQQDILLNFGIGS